MFSVSCLQCYSCVREDEPDALQYCALPSSGLGNNAVVNCSSDENHCTIVKTIFKDGSVATFRRSCAVDGQCPKTECTGPADGQVVCKSCCEKNLCNKGKGPTPAELSGASSLTLMRGVYVSGAFLACFLCKVIITWTQASDVLVLVHFRCNAILASSFLFCIRRSRTVH